MRCCLPACLPACFASLLTSLSPPAAGLLFRDGAAELAIEPLELSILVAGEGFERGGKCRLAETSALSFFQDWMNLVQVSVGVAPAFQSWYRDVASYCIVSEASYHAPCLGLASGLLAGRRSLAAYQIVGWGLHAPRGTLSGLV